MKGDVDGPRRESRRMPVVSVVIPAFNPGPFLRDALESLRDQVFQEWEAIVVDDASTEDLCWVSTFDDRVRLVTQQHGGASRARNLGVLLTSGELVAFMDQDDLWSPSKLERQVAVLQREPSVGLCHSDLEVFRDPARPDHRASGGQPLTYEIVLSPTEDRTGSSQIATSLAYFARSFVVPSSMMVRRSCLADSGLLDPFLPFTGDYDALIKIGGRHGVARLRHTDVYYRKHDSNFSDAYDVGRLELKAMIARYVNYAKATGDVALGEAARKLLRRPRTLYAAQAYDCSRRALGQRDYRATAQHLTRAFMFSPRFVLRSMWSYLQARRS
jgi:glycosyltransferase involved in cell wall biosynthesis